MNDIEDTVEEGPWQFPPKKTEAEQWQLVRVLLSSKDGRDSLIDSVANSMERRQRVNIQRITTAVSDRLGPQYGDLAGEVLRQAASRTSIEVL